MYCTDPAQHPITTGWALDDRDCYLSEVWNIASVHVLVGIYCTQAAPKRRVFLQDHLTIRTSYISVLFDVGLCMPSCNTQSSLCKPLAFTPLCRPTYVAQRCPIAGGEDVRRLPGVSASHGDRNDPGRSRHSSRLRLPHQVRMRNHVATSRINRGT